MSDWYKHYRPRTISDMFITSPIIEGLPNMINNTIKNLKGNRVPDCMLFYGAYPGIGKTTCALNVAIALNPTMDQDTKNQIFLGEENSICRKFNGATENGIDSIREIQKQINYLRYSMDPDRRYVFIYDEIHKLTDAAKQAFLDVIEFLPENVFIIGTTTEINSFIADDDKKDKKVGSALKSRFKRFEFKPLSLSQIGVLLADIGKKEGYDNVPNNIIEAIYATEKGLPRDSIQALETYYCLGRLPEIPISESQFMDIKYVDLITSLLKMSIKGNPLTYKVFMGYIDGLIAKDKPEDIRVKMMQASYGITLRSMDAMVREYPESSQPELFGLFNIRMAIITSIMETPVIYPEGSNILSKFQRVYSSIIQTTKPENLKYFI